MHTLMHLAGMLFFCCLFLLGGLMIEGRQLCAEPLMHFPVSNAHLCKFSSYGGRIFESVALVCGFLEVVTVTILTSAWVIDILVATVL